LHRITTWEEFLLLAVPGRDDDDGESDQARRPSVLRFETASAICDL
jgi:hypothetical protein